MSERWFDDLEIVGFNGAPLVECGRALPIARRKSDGMHCVLELRQDGSPPNWHGEQEAADYADAQRWTLFETPVFVPRSCCLDTKECPPRQPMVVFADETMLDTADRLPRPPMPGDDYLIWRRLKGYSDRVRAACGSAETVEPLLNDWACALLKRFDAMYSLGRDCEYLKRIADFALCAAKERSLRWRSYLRYATAQEADRVRSTFEKFTRREFPDVGWEAFVTELECLRDVLRAIPARTPDPPSPPSHPSTALPKMRGIAAARPIEEHQLVRP